MAFTKDVGFLYCYTWPVPETFFIFEFGTADTAEICKKHGHCLHESTAVGLFICCRCGQYISREIEV